MKRRYRHFTDNEIKRKWSAKPTKKSNKNADNILKNYLDECGHESYDYVHYPHEDLDKILVKFWFSICKKNSKDGTPEFYLKNTLQNIWHALNRNVCDPGHRVEIPKDSKYVDSQKAYKDAYKELKAQGRAVVRSYPEINHKGKINVKYFKKTSSWSNLSKFFTQCNPKYVNSKKQK